MPGVVGGKVVAHLTDLAFGKQLEIAIFF